MFSALNQGSLVYILDKTKNVKFSIGEVVGTTVPQYAIDGSGMIMNLTIKVNDEKIEYKNVPSGASSVSYNNGKLIIAETKQTIQSEVESTLHNANYIVEHIDDYKNQIAQCEEVLKQLNPQYAKDKARDERIAGIEFEVAGMKDDIAKILAAVTKT
ncbi:MAG: hypothetical protein PUJ60_01820 [bacterium]|nr:hypothetical protein [bacterium]MDY4108888.1 hypothetical protein [Bacilli bacterium]